MRPRFRAVRTGAAWLTVVATALASIMSLSGYMRRMRETSSPSGHVIYEEPDNYSLAGAILGAFGGMASKVLWMKAYTARWNSRFFELGDLYAAMSKLQPQNHMTWIFQAWEMSSNISQSYDNDEARDYWLWRGMSHLSLAALKVLPENPEICQDLSQTLVYRFGDSGTGHPAYHRRKLALRMETEFSLSALPKKQNKFLAAASPAYRQDMLNKTGMRVEIMLKLNRDYGDFDWRTAPAQAFYWAWLAKTLADARGDGNWLFKLSLVNAMSAVMDGGIWNRDADSGLGGPERDIGKFTAFISLMESLSAYGGSREKESIGYAFFARAKHTAARHGSLYFSDKVDREAQEWLNRHGFAPEQAK